MNKVSPIWNEIADRNESLVPEVTNTPIASFFTVLQPD